MWIVNGISLFHLDQLTNPFAPLSQSSRNSTPHPPTPHNTRSILTARRRPHHRSLVFDYCTRTGQLSGQRRNAVLVGGDLYDALVEKITTECCRIYSTRIAVAPIVTPVYIAEFKSFVQHAKTVRSLVSYLDRHWVPRAQEERRSLVLPVYSTAMMIWRDTVLRRPLCLERMAAEECAGQGSSDSTAEVIASVANLYDGWEMWGLDDEESDLDRRLMTTCESVVHIQEALATRPLHFQVPKWVGWTRKTHRECCKATRMTVMTLMLVRHRLQFSPVGQTKMLPRTNEIDIWCEIAQCLPR